MSKNALSNIENIYVFLEKSPCVAEGRGKSEILCKGMNAKIIY